MKSSKNLLVAFLSIVLVSCGPNAEQKAAMEKAKMDSVAKATEEKIKAEQDSIIAAKESENAAIVEAAATEDQLIQSKADLAAAEAKMEDIKAFKLGRTNDEKQEQIRQQTEIIERLKIDIKNLEKEYK